MGFALFAFTSLYRPLRHLGQWRRPTNLPHHVADQRPARPAYDRLGCETPPLAQDETCPAVTQAPGPVRQCPVTTPVEDAPAPCVASRPAAVARLRPLRVILRQDTDNACKLVISGRMADVCAELERLAMH